jgi:hypothetical protein
LSNTPEDETEREQNGESKAKDAALLFAKYQRKRRIGQRKIEASMISRKNSSRINSTNL